MQSEVKKLRSLTVRDAEGHATVVDAKKLKRNQSRVLLESVLPDPDAENIALLRRIQERLARCGVGAPLLAWSTPPPLARDGASWHAGSRGRQLPWAAPAAAVRRRDQPVPSAFSCPVGWALKLLRWWDPFEFLQGGHGAAVY
jgi:hypothetical protein